MRRAFLSLGLLAALCACCAATPAVVQATCGSLNSGGVTSTTLAFGSAVTSGDMVLVTGGVGSGTPSVSDSLSNTFTHDSGSTALNNLWYSSASTGGADTVTLSSTATTTYGWCIAELSGTSGVLDAVGYGMTPGSGTVNTTPTITTSNASDIIIAGYDEPYASDNTGNVTVGSPYSLDNAVTTKAGIASQNVSSSGSITGATFTSQYGGYPSGVTAAFKASGGGGPTCDHAISLLGAGCS